MNLEPLKTRMPYIGIYLRKISAALIVISAIATVATLCYWLYAIAKSDGRHHHYIEYEDTISTVTAFIYFVSSIASLLYSLALLGFSYIVSASVDYLERHGCLRNEEEEE